MDDPASVSLTTTDDAGEWLARDAERVIETSCARIYLFGDRALKVKRPVMLGFLDFSTAEKRRWALQRELTFNRATAPDIYRSLRAIKRRPDGGYGLDGPGETLDWALETRRFDDDAVLANHPDWVTAELAETLGRTIAMAHAEAPVSPSGGGLKAMAYTVESNAGHLRTLADRLGESAVERVVAATDLALAEQAPLLEARRAAGFARRCHGDLHLGNILLENNAPILFDCIEFNDALSEIDPLYDLAFLLMDLVFRGRREAANRVLNAYLDEAARTFPASLWTGLAAMPLMLSARATVRAHVSAATGDVAVARAYLVAAEQHLAAPPPRLFAVGGLSGSGKTTFARALAPQIPGAPGAVILRTDEIRKRQWGVRPLDRLPRSAYSAEASRRAYVELFALADAVLATGRSVILDAAFLTAAERDRAETLGRRRGLSLQGVWMDGDAATLRRRLAARTGDASDADGPVLDRQLAGDQGAVSWRRLRSQSEIDQALADLPGG